MINDDGSISNALVVRKLDKDLDKDESVFIKEHLDGVFIIGIVRNKKIRGIAYENTLFVKSTAVPKYLWRVSGKPPHQGMGLCVLGQFA